MAYLDGVKVGDKLWSIQLGECVVIDVENGERYPIVAEGSEYSARYMFDGRHDIHNCCPSLFWSKPEFELPPRPKRMVKKGVWINIYPEETTSNICRTKELADAVSGPNRIACIKIEYEVEE